MGGASARLRSLASVGLLLAEIVGCLCIWIVIPAGWMWIAAQVYEATLSIAADLAVALGGFIVTITLAMSALNRIDMMWVELRRQSGHEQREGALTRIVVVTAGVGFAAFYIWFHFIEQAFILQFMPTN
jgi:hypothetical protein